MLAPSHTFNLSGREEACPNCRGGEYQPVREVELTHACGCSAWMPWTAAQPPVLSLEHAAATVCGACAAGEVRVAA